jgi:hypothetical protein
MINPLTLKLIQQDYPEAISYMFLNEMPLVEIISKDGYYVEMPVDTFRARYMPKVTLC